MCSLSNHTTLCNGHQVRQPPLTAVLTGISPCGRFITLQDTRTGETTDYTVEVLPTAWEGIAARLTKPDGTAYDVFAAARGHDLCDCQGFTRFGYCRHVSYVRLALSNQWLPGMAGVTIPVRAQAVQSDPVECEHCGDPVDDPFENLCADCQKLSPEERAYWSGATPLPRPAVAEAAPAF